MRELLALTERCHEKLRHSPIPFRYLNEQRGFGVSLIKSERMGFCDPETARWFAENKPENWNIEPDYIRKQLENCIILPIRDDCGRIAGVAARNPEAKKGWWNTPFTKEACLYGMDTARTAAYARNKLYLVEGYADRLTIYQAGLKNVSALMSTTLSLHALAVVLRYCDRICAIFDADPPKDGKPGAGQQALRRLVEDYNQSGYLKKIHAIVIELRPGPEGELLKDDPDAFVRREGLEKLLAMERTVKRDF
jgi:DNA primase